LIKRSTTSNLQQAADVATVPNNGNATGGAVYEVTDSGLTTGQTYYYWLIELQDDNTQQMLSENPEFESPGGTPSQTNTPTHTATSIATQQTPTRTPTATAVGTQPAGTNTPTATTIAAQATATNTPTASRSTNPTATPTTPPAGATPTFTVPSQPADTPSAPSTPTPISTNTPLPATTDTPQVAINTPIVEGVTPDPASAELLARTGATAGAPQENGEGAVQPTDPSLQVPATPTQVTGAAELSGEAAANTPPTVQEADQTPQAVAQGSNSGEIEQAGRLARPTATPRPVTAEVEDSSGSLLLILGGTSLCGAVVLALAALVIWRRR
jgi:hypothetical protein